MRATTRIPNRKVNDLAFADDIGLLENDNAQAQRQLDALRHHASSVGLEINVKKTEQMRLNQPPSAAPLPPLLIDSTVSPSTLSTSTWARTWGLPKNTSAADSP